MYSMKVCISESTRFIFFNSPTSVMDTELPDVLNQLVGSYEQFIKTQKEKSDLISKFSDSGLKKVKQDTTLQEQVCSKHNYLSLAISSAPPPPPPRKNKTHR